MKRILVASICLFLLSMLAIAPAFAGPAIPAPMQVTQPDGTKLKVHLRGDEYQNWTELAPGGQTIVKNPANNVWEYAEQLPDGTLKASGIKAEPDGRNAPPTIRKGLKPKRNQELEQRMPELMESPQPAPASGDRKVLVVLVGFSDRSPVTTPAGWYGKLFDTTTGVKSMANFYRDNSFGAVTVSPAQHTQPGRPAGIMTATVSDQHPNYGGSISYSLDAPVANHALAQVAPYIAFSSFDTNNDGILAPSELAIYFIFAGYEASGSYMTPSVWAHAWSYAPITAGTTTVNYWALNGELNSSSTQHPMGVIVHELGHSLFALPDLYDTNGVNEGMGNFSTMAGGSWGRDVGEYSGTTPTTLDAWSRRQLGWLNLVEPVQGTISLSPSLTSATAGFTLIRTSIRAWEYFLVDNRQPVGWDRGLRGYFGSGWLGGLLVIHVDDSVYSNAYVAGRHQRVVPVQASTAYCDMLVEGAYCRGHATTLFYQGNNQTWNPGSAPNSNYYDTLQTGFSLTGISVPQTVMTALYQPEVAPPVVSAFSIPATSSSLVVPISSLMASDNVAVTGYLINESSTTPSAGSTGWSAVRPTSYTFTSAGVKRLYAWAKDEAGNVSASRSATVTISGVDAILPVVTAFTIPATSSSLTVPITTFTATDNIGVTGYLVNESSTKPSAEASGWSSARPASYSFATSGAKRLYAWARDAAGNVSNSRSATVTVTAALPTPWVTRDIGSVGLAGSAGYLNGLFTLMGSGSDIYGTADSFRFVYRPMTGDVQITARVTSLQNTHSYAKGGVMIRQSLTAGSSHATMALTPAGMAQMLRRSTSGGTTVATSTSYPSLAYWVRLVRRGSTFTGSISSDGVNWVQVSSSTVSMTGTVYVGLAVTSRNNSALCSASFSEVAASPPDTTLPTVTAFSVPATVSSATIPITTFTATDNVGVTGYLVNESPTKPSAGASGWSSTRPASYVTGNAGAITLYAWARDAAGNVSNSRSANVTVSVIPAPWGTRDIGSVGLVGSASYLNGVFTLRGSGADIYGTADAFRFAYTQLTGDGQIIARVASIQNTHAYAKAGVMMRQSLASNSMHAMMTLTPGGQAQFLRRTATGGTTATTARSGISAPYWVRLVRMGNTFTGSISSDRVNWVQVSSSTISMTGTVYVGLAVTSRNNSVLCSATFNEVAASLPDTTLPVVTAFSIPATVSALTIPITTFTATDNVGVTGYLVNESATKPSAGASGWSSTRPASYVTGNLGTLTLYAWARDAAGNVSNSRSATVTVSGLPVPWYSRDIGSVGLAGSASYLNGVFTLRGAGADIYGTVDGFRFVYKQLTGDGQIVARVTSVQNTHTYAKAGVMMRQSLAANSTHAMMSLTPGGQAQFLRRTATGGTTAATARSGIAAPYWVRLVRSGNTFTGSISSDGVTWVQVGSSTISMTSTLYVGLAVTSRNNAALCTATMSGVQ